MNKITIQNIINADPTTVWSCYTQGDHIVHWNFASDDWCCPHASVDLRVGGIYLARMEAKDGSFGFDFETTITKLDEGTSFEHIMSDGRAVEVTLSTVSEGTLIQVSFDPENENPHDMQRDGWQAILNNFKKYVENKD